MKLNKQEVHRIVEYIKIVGADLDAADVEEDVEGVLWQYGYYDSLSDEDLEAIKVGWVRRRRRTLRPDADGCAGPQDDAA